jgi:hypothetical protein
VVRVETAAIHVKVSLLVSNFEKFAEIFDKSPPQPLSLAQSLPNFCWTLRIQEPPEETG